jgi:hypothetical protein
VGGRITCSDKSGETRIPTKIYEKLISGCDMTAQTTTEINLRRAGVAFYQAIRKCKELTWKRHDTAFHELLAT